MVKKAITQKMDASKDKDLIIAVNSATKKELAQYVENFLKDDAKI